MTEEGAKPVALVTGASRGIGAAIASALRAQDCFVVGTATGEKGVSAIASRLGDDGLALSLDLASQDAIAELGSRLKSDGLVPEILVNNAAITRDDLLLRMDLESWQAVVDTDLTGVFSLTKLCLRGMLKRRRGRIINLTSVVGFMGNAGQANYAAAKAGLIGFTKSLAREVASRGITANCVAPGFIDTDMTRALDEDQRAALLSQIPLARFGTVDDVAATVAFLAGPGGAYITGETIHVNGGMLMP